MLKFHGALGMLNAEANTYTRGRKIQQLLFNVDHLLSTSACYRNSENCLPFSLSLSLPRTHSLSKSKLSIHDVQFIN